MADELLLACAAARETDRIHFSRSTTGKLLISVRDAPDTVSCYLTEKQAREVFNYLGVQLHKGGWGPSE